MSTIWIHWYDMIINLIWYWNINFEFLNIWYNLLNYRLFIILFYFFFLSILFIISKIILIKFFLDKIPNPIPISPTANNLQHFLEQILGHILDIPPTTHPQALGQDTSIPIPYCDTVDLLPLVLWHIDLPVSVSTPALQFGHTHTDWLNLRCDFDGAPMVNADGHLRIIGRILLVVVDGAQVVRAVAETFQWVTD